MSSSKTINWSIIIPHYNQPNLLDRLLFTIPFRDDLEIIVIDDCSDWQFEKPLKAVLDKYPKVHFMTTQSRGGGGKARNIGMESAKGKYLIFADSDDYFLPNFSTILDKYCNTDVDVIFYNIISLDSETGDYCSRWKHIDNFFQLYNTKKTDLALRYLFGEPWGKIIKKSLVCDNNILFDIVPIHNDTTFSYLVGYYAKEICVENVRAYCLTYRLGSVSNTVSNTISWERLEIRLNVFSRKYIFFKEHKIPLSDPLFITPFWICIKQRNYKQFRKLIQIVGEYEIPQYVIYERLLVYVTNKFVKKIIALYRK